MSRLDRRALPTGRAFDGQHAKTAPHARARRHRSRKPHPVDAVVDDHPARARKHLGEHRDAEREGEEPMGDGRPERASPPRGPRRRGSTGSRRSPARSGRFASCDTSSQLVGPSSTPTRFREHAHRAGPETRRHRPQTRSSASSLPRSARLSYRPGDTFEPVTATRIGGYTARGFSSSSAQRRFKRNLYLLDRPRLGLAERIDGGREDALVEEARIRLDVVKEEAREPRELAESGRSSPARAAPPPGCAPLANRSPALAGTRRDGSRTRPAEARAGRRRSSSRASRSRRSRGSSPRARARSARRAHHGS